MPDFTFDMKKQLLQAFLDNGYQIITFRQFLNNELPEKFLILRHDVDRYPGHSLKMARIEHAMGINATYYFRTRKYTYIPEIIHEIRDMGHEVGYHYENLSDTKGDVPAALADFEKSLESLRQHAEITTICMHGSPLSPYDNKLMWENSTYQSYEIDGDTSFDVDYDKVFYVTDNGWGWNKLDVSVRDKVETNFSIPIHSTSHFIELLNKGELPCQMMLNAHPDTFNDLCFVFPLF